MTVKLRFFVFQKKNMTNASPLFSPGLGEEEEAQSTSLPTGVILI